MFSSRWSISKSEKKRWKVGGVVRTISQKKCVTISQMRKKHCMFITKSIVIIYSDDESKSQKETDPWNYIIYYI